MHRKTDKIMLWTGLILVVISVFSLAAMSYSFPSGTDKPFQGTERLSPADRIGSDQIVESANGFAVKGIGNVRIVSIADTNSMDPVIDAESTVIEIVPLTETELKLGDIISYKSGTDAIIHRIIEIGTDEQGWYAVVKGDNNSVADPERVRFSQIKGVVVGILY